MKWTIALTAALVAAGSAQSQTSGRAESVVAPTANWIPTLNEKCGRCVSAKSIRGTSPVPLPERAIIYSFTGEFAKHVDWWLINLDTGQIIRWEAILTGAGERKETITAFGTINPSTLERVRASAAILWRSQPYLPVRSPGTVEEDYVVSGSQMVAFSRFAPDDRDIVAAINSSLPADAVTTTGSFVVPSQH
jgi:hypothetical protein